MTITTPAHQRVQFTEAEPAKGDKLAICNYGEHGTGKTNLIATAPDVGVVPLDRKTRATIAKARETFGITSRIWFPKDDYIRTGNAMELALMTPEQSMVYYRKHVNLIKDAC